MINHVILKESAIRLSYINQIGVSFCEVSMAGWNKNLENYIKLLMSVLENLPYMGQEYSFIHTKENVMDIIEQIPT